MNIKQLNRIIKEELELFLLENEEEMDMPDMEGGDDEDIEVTTDEPAEDDATELLRQIYDMIKPEIEGDEEPEMDMEEPEGEEGEEEEGEEEEGDEEEEELDEAVDNHTFFRADNGTRVNPQAKDVQGTREKMNESVIRRKNNSEFVSRFQRLANIQK
jgi:hypothetical protein